MCYMDKHPHTHTLFFSLTQKLHNLLFLVLTPHLGREIKRQGSLYHVLLLELATNEYSHEISTNEEKNEQCSQIFPGNWNAVYCSCCCAPLCPVVVFTASCSVLFLSPHDLRAKPQPARFRAALYWSPAVSVLADVTLNYLPT